MIFINSHSELLLYSSSPTNFAFGNMAWFTIRVIMGDKYDKVLNMNSLKQRLCYEDTNMYISKKTNVSEELTASIIRFGVCRQ